MFKILLASTLFLASISASADCPDISGIYRIELAKVSRVANESKIKGLVAEGACRIAGDANVRAPVVSGTLTALDANDVERVSYIFPTNQACMFQVHSRDRQNLTMEQVRTSLDRFKPIGGSNTYIDFASLKTSSPNVFYSKVVYPEAYNPQFRVYQSRESSRSLQVLGNGNLMLGSTSKSTLGRGRSQQVSEQYALCHFKKVGDL